MEALRRSLDSISSSKKKPAQSIWCRKRRPAGAAGGKTSQAPRTKTA